MEDKNTKQFEEEKGKQVLNIVETVQEPKDEINESVSSDVKDNNIKDKHILDTFNTTEKEQIDKTGNTKFTITHDEEFMDDEVAQTNAAEFNIIELSSITLLRGTVTELDRALRDSRELIKSRDSEIIGLRKEIEKGREQIHKEQMKWQRKSAQAEERNREIQELKKKLSVSEKANEELSERIKEFESPYSESDGVSLCCSSMKELMEVKLELAERDLLLDEIQKNNCPDHNTKAIAAKDGWETESSVKAEECEQHNQLKLKFLRDAFFYFMIDFHSEEQMKAILAVLAYGDQREDVIKQAYRMRQRGKKFSVKEVSSRGLSFLHEEI